MKRKLSIGISLFVIIAIAYIGSFFSNYKEIKNTSYNLNPDVSKKMIGSKEIRELTWSMPIKSIDDLVSYADLIVTGQVVSDGVTTTEDWPNVVGDPEGKTALSKRPPVTVTHTEIKIDKILYGKASSDTITLLQLGKAGDDKGETKVKKNNKMLFVLKGSNDGRNIYSSVCYEDGFFEIGDDSKVMSLSNEITLSKYDGAHIDLLTRDVIKGLENKKK